MGEQGIFYGYPILPEWKKKGVRGVPARPNREQRKVISRQPLGHGRIAFLASRQPIKAEEAMIHWQGEQDGRGLACAG